MLKLITQQASKDSRPGTTNLRPGESAPNFTLTRHSVSEGFLANLRYLLTERRVTIPGEAEGSAFLPPKFRASFFDNLKEHLRPTPKVAGNTVGSLRGIASPGIKIESQPLYRSVLLNLRDAVIPPKLPPLELTSKPVDVPEIWSAHKRLSGPNAASVLLHVIFAVLVLAFTVRQVTNLDPVKPVTVLIVPPALGAPSPPPPAPAAATHRAAYTKRKSFFVHGKLTAPSEIPKPASAKRHASDADPPDLSLSGVPGGDPAGTLGGILGGAPGGIPGGVPGGISVAPPPPGVALTKSGAVRVGGRVKQPKAIYAPAPQFPLLAQHAKISGIVVLDAIIDEHGNVVKLHPVSGDSLLIGAALRAVAQWKFEPTYLDGKPISIEMEVKVSFHFVN